MKLENGGLSKISRRTEQLIGRYFTSPKLFITEIQGDLVTSKGGCLFKKINSLISSKRQFSGEKIYEKFHEKKFNSLTHKCPSNKLAIVNTNLAHEIDCSLDL